MTHRIRRVGVLKAGLIGAAIYAIMSLVFLPFLLFFAFVTPMAEGPGSMPGEWMMSGAFVLLAPFFYAVFGFITTALGALIYNLVAMMTGGLEIELQAIGGPIDRPDTGAAPVY